MTDASMPENADSTPEEAPAKKYDWENDPDGYTLDDVTPKDRYLNAFLLFILGSHDDGLDGSFGITLTTTGGTVSGIAITREAWIEGIKSQLRHVTTESNQETFDAIDTVFTGFSRMASEKSRERDANELPIAPRQFIHLRDAHLGVGPSSATTAFWRGSLADVIGWSVGSIDND
jgi:hypothetical protein